MGESICFCSKIRQTARIITAVYDEALNPAGLTAAQFHLLHVVRRTQTPTIGAIAEAARLDRSTLGRNVRVLERSGLVRLRLGKDGRTRVVEISDEALRRLAIANPLWESVQRNVSTQLDGGARDQALKLLGILENFT